MICSHHFDCLYRNQALLLRREALLPLDYLSRGQALPLGRCVSLPLIAFIGVLPSGREALLPLIY